MKFANLKMDNYAIEKNEKDLLFKADNHMRISKCIKCLCKELHSKFVSVSLCD